MRRVGFRTQLMDDKETSDIDELLEFDSRSAVLFCETLYRLSHHLHHAIRHERN